MNDIVFSVHIKASSVPNECVDPFTAIVMNGSIMSVFVLNCNIASR